jgi:hypothetical protein
VGIGWAVLSLMLTLLCGTAVAQEFPRVRSIGVGPTKTAIPPNTRAKDLFGSVTAPAPLPARAVGSYTRGCLAGGVALPTNGPGWQVMRLARNRNWGHPMLVSYLERFGKGRPLDRLARPLDRGFGAAARGSDAHWPHEPSDRAGCRHLADPNAEPDIYASRAGGPARELPRARQGLCLCERVILTPKQPDGGSLAHSRA